MTNPVTAATVRQSVLEPAMDRVAQTTEELRLIHNPDTPEHDSIVELLCEAQRVNRQLATIVQRLAAINTDELETHRQVAGWADGVVTALRDTELNGDSETESGRQLAQRIIALLEAIDSPDAIDAMYAGSELFSIFRATSRDLLFRHAVTYVLGAKRTGRLDELHTTFQTRRAMRPVSA